MIEVQGYSSSHVAVLGLGRSGLTVARALIDGGARVSVWDDNENTRARAAFDGLMVKDLTRQGAFEDISTLIVSPGIAHLYPEPHPVVANALEAGVKIDNDIGVFFASLGRADWDRFDVAPRTVAVTGSNGKSTVSALIHHILLDAERDVQLGGNIGVGVFDLDPPQDGGVIVVELSSYQIELARALTPDIAVFTNLSPDHLDRHGGIGGYFAAKKRLFSEGGPDRAIIGIDEVEGRFLANSLSSGPTDDRVISISSKGKIQGPGWNVFARKGFLAEWRKGRQIASIDLRDMKALPGAHNHQNACAAYAVCRSLGLAPRVIETAMRGFGGLRHRSQWVAEIDGVTFVNDSKATNVDAAFHGLSGFKNIHWIAGGRAKDGGFGALIPALENVKHAYLIGEAAGELAQTLGDKPLTKAGTLDIAVRQAFANAQAGDTVLLAPACASQDQFESFEARGDAFVEAVGALSSS